MQKRKKTPKQHRISPRLVPVDSLAKLWSLRGRTYALSAPGEPVAELRRLVCSEVDFDELTATGIGGLRDLLKVQANLSHASLVARAVVQDLVRDVGELLMRPHVRLIVATRLLGDAMLFLDGAFVLHVRKEAKPKPALVLLRSALELVGRATVIAEGTRDEVDAFANAGERIPSHTAVAGLDELAGRHGLAAAGPLYGWLSSIAHYDVQAVGAEPGRADVYAVLAYVSVIAARLAEVLTGTALAEFPTMPSELPWLRPPKPLERLIITDDNNVEVPHCH